MLPFACYLTAALLFATAHPCLAMLCMVAGTTGLVLTDPDEDDEEE